MGAIFGSAFGATMAAITGQDIGKGAAMGATSGMGFAGAHMMIGEHGITDVTQAALVHAGVGAATGAINAAIGGGNIGMGALTGGVSGGISKIRRRHVARWLRRATWRENDCWSNGGRHNRQDRGRGFGKWNV